MNISQKIFKNVGVLLISHITSYILGFFFLIYTARYLGSEGYGILSFAIAFTGMLGIFADIGLNTLLTREIAKDKSLSNILIGNILMIKIILALIAFSLIAIIINLLFYPQQIIYVVYIIALSIIIGTFSSMFNALFQAYEEMEYISISQILSSFLLFLGALFAIFSGFNVVAFAFIYLISSLIVLLYNMIICLWKFDSIPIKKFELNFWKYLLIEALPLSIILLLTAMYFKVDIIMLSIMKDNLAVGIYSVPYRVLEMLMVLPAIFTSTIFPILSKFYVSSYNSLKKTYLLSCKYMIILGIPAAFGVFLLADQIILILFGNDYFESINALKILIWSIPFIYLIYIFQIILISIQKQNLIVKIAFIALIINITLNIVFIPLYSYLGASVVTLITESFIFITSLYYLSKLIDNTKILNFTLKPILASIIMGIFILLLNTNLILKIIIAIIVYFMAMFILKGFSDEDYKILRDIIKIED